MSARYEPVGRERFTVEPTERGERIRLRPPRPLFATLFLPFWLVGWTLGGIAATHALLRDFQPFLALWLCGWAVGWLAAAGSLVWMLAGSETIGLEGGDIEIAHHAPGLSRRWLYRGSQVRNLTAGAPAEWSSQFGWNVAFLRSARHGAIRFDYGARTVRAAAGLDEAEARLVIERLARRLPRLAAVQRP